MIHSFTWGKFAGLILVVGLAAVLVATANKQVFPESYWIANGMLIITFSVAAIFSVASGFAALHVKKYILIVLVVLSVTLAGNLALHWVVARAFSGVRQVVSARHIEEDRADERVKNRTEQTKELLGAQKELVQADTKNKQMDAIRYDSARRAGVAPAQRKSQSTAPGMTMLPLPEIEPAASAAGPPTAPASWRSVEEVLAYFLPWLMGFAIADLLISVGGFGVCAMLWEWEKNPSPI